MERCGKRRESAFYCVPDFNIGQPLVYHHGPLMVREGEGGKAEAESINMNFLFDGVYGRLHFRRLAESRFMGEREKRESERPSHKGRARNNGVPPHEEHTLTLEFSTQYTLFPSTVCMQAVN